VIGVNAGYAFSFVRDLAVELRWAAVAAEGSQFRSRDLFPEAAAAIALGQPDALDEEIPPSDIPDVPPNCIAYIDGYGNLKTTIKHDSKPDSGHKVRLQIGEGEQEAIASDGSFAVESGQLAFAPGSSGWTNAQGEHTRWMEVFLRGGNAWEAFGRPAIGTAIQMG
jgi:S-adenosylmethionine hydrolase